MNVASPLPSPLVTPTSSGDAPNAARTTGDETDAANRDAFARLLSELGGGPADPAAATVSMDAGTAAAAAGDDIPGDAARSLAVLLSQAAGEPPAAQTDPDVRATQVAALAAQPVAALQSPTTVVRPSIDVPVLVAQPTPPAAPVMGVAGGAKTAAATTDRGSAAPTVDDASPDAFAFDDAAASAEPKTHENATRAGLRIATGVRRGQPSDIPSDAEAAASAAGTATAAPTSVPAPSAPASFSPTTVATPSAAAIAAAAPAQVILAQTQSEPAPRPQPAAVPAAAGRAASPGKTAAAPVSAPRTEAIVFPAARNDDGVATAAMPQSRAEGARASDADTPAVAVAASGGPLATAVLVSQETHLPLAANGPAMQVAVAVKAELVGAVSESDVSPAATAAEPTVAAGRTLVRTLSIVLTPEHLGTVSVDLRLSGGRLELSIAAAHHDAAQAIERDRAVLSDALRASGVSVDALVVRTAASSPAGDPSLGASGGSSQQHAAQQGGSTASGGGAPNGGAGGDGRQATGSDRRSNGDRTPPRPKPPDRSGGSLVV